eukprot:2620312-Amphidinium_carterae.3
MLWASSRIGVLHESGVMGKWTSVPVGDVAAFNSTRPHAVATTKSSCQIVLYTARRAITGPDQAQLDGLGFPRHGLDVQLPTIMEEEALTGYITVKTEIMPGAHHCMATPTPSRSLDGMAMQILQRS